MAIKKNKNTIYVPKNKVINYIVFDSLHYYKFGGDTGCALSIIVAFPPQTKLRSQWRPDPLF